MFFALASDPLCNFLSSRGRGEFHAFDATPVAVSALIGRKAKFVQVGATNAPKQQRISGSFLKTDFHHVIVPKLCAM